MNWEALTKSPDTARARMGHFAETLDILVGFYPLPAEPLDNYSALMELLRQGVGAGLITYSEQERIRTSLQNKLF